MFSSCGAVAPAGVDVAQPADAPAVLLTIRRRGEETLVQAGQVGSLARAQRGEHGLDRGLAAREHPAGRPAPLRGELEGDRAPVGADPPLDQAGRREPVDQPPVKPCSAVRAAGTEAPCGLAASPASCTRRATSSASAPSALTSCA